MHLNIATQLGGVSPQLPIVRGSFAPQKKMWKFQSPWLLVSMTIYPLVSNKVTFSFIILKTTHLSYCTLQIDDVELPSWQAQIRGTKKWTLEPPPECYLQCKSLNVIVHPGEISKFVWRISTVFVDLVFVDLTFLSAISSQFLPLPLKKPA